MNIVNITKNYQLNKTISLVLKDITFTVNSGDMLAIVGASGSGKSTLMNLLGLLDRFDCGEYQLQGKNTAMLNNDELARMRNQYIGFIFQQFHLLPRFSDLQNVALPLMYRKISQTNALKQALDALSRVGMQSFARHRPMQLSGGQQQRIAIARALVGEPQVILADEPTGALDSNTSNEVMKLFLSLNAEGRTLILVTHDERVASLCSRQITLADGEIVARSL